MSLPVDLLNEVIAFFNVRPVIHAYQTGGFISLFTTQSILLLIGAAVPIFFLLELLALVVAKKFRVEKYKVTFMIYVFNAVIAKFVVIDIVALAVNYLGPYALFQTRFTWYWFLYSYVIWEFSQFVFHYSCHKIRLLWCTHATHHAIEHMNLSVAFTGFFLQGLIAYGMRAGICILLGLTLPMLALIMVLDGLWGGLVHIGEDLLRDGRLGFLERFILTPAHHRVHHSRNPEYIDKNFCNLLNFWDRIFGTYQTPLPSVAPDYGIARPINANSFNDVYFSEFAYLWRDLRKARSLRNRLLYLVMPPGWQPAKIL